MKKRRPSIGFIFAIIVLLCVISGCFYPVREELNQRENKALAIDKGNISDSWLREVVKKQIDRNHDNMLTEIEREAVSELKLYIGGEETTVKLSKLNLFPNLKTLTLEIGGGGKTISLSDVKYIEKLHCISMSLDKSSIECTGARKLTSLKVTAERKEYPITIHIEKCPMIKELQTEGAGVTDLGLSGVPVMKKVVMKEAVATSLDFHNLPELEEVILYDTSEVQKLTLHDLPKLKNVELNYLYRLKKIILYDLPNIKALFLMDASNLNQIDLSKLKSLKNLELHGTPLNNLDLSFCTELEKIQASRMNKVTKLDLESQKLLQYFEWINGKLHSIQWGEMKMLAEIDVENNQLSGEWDLKKFPVLYKLDFPNNKYERILGRGHKKISYIYGDNNRLKLVDLRNVAKIESVIVESNKQVTAYLPSHYEEFFDSDDFRFDPEADIYYGEKLKKKGKKKSY